MTLGTVKNALTKLAKRSNVTLVRKPTGHGNGVTHIYTVTDHESDAEQQ